jgi:Ni/Fe-hydrogenase 1 B-type cytochrome subunit
VGSESSGMKVYDPLLRTLHWGIVGSVVALIATSQLAELFEDGPVEDALWQWHILAGYVLVSVLAARVLWGLVGPEAARWRDLWHPGDWRGMLRLAWPAKRVGHDAAASLGYLLVYGLLAMMAATGLGLAGVEFGAGPLGATLNGARGIGKLLEEPHEAGFALILGFIVLHLGALVFHQWRGERVAQSMVTGRQYLEAEGADHA